MYQTTLLLPAKTQTRGININTGVLAIFKDKILTDREKPFTQKR